MKIRTKQGYMKQFRTIKGIREDMISPLLFNLYIADIDNELEKRRIGRVRLDRDRIWSLAHVDNLVLIAYNRESLQDMMSTLTKFLEGKKLELCTEKTKIMRSGGRGRKRKEKWKWRNKELNEMQEFKYLDFNLDRKGKYALQKAY